MRRLFILQSLPALALLTGGWLQIACGGVSYNRDIRPILSDKCFACHGPDANTREADLRLDLREAAIEALSPDDPDNSAVLERIASNDDDVRMPPPETHKRVTAAEAAKLRQWIADGAEYEAHWSLIPLQPVAPPEADSDWVTSDIDRFVLAQLRTHGVQPSPLADRATLIRRITLDLTGLPPTPAEVDAFVNDPADLDTACATLVDRLLASPRFGEHFAWHWLDAARYGDSDGYESDPMRNMWPWRDWVVDAFNSNMPYDQFIIEQLAGDLLERPTLRQLVATGFNRNHRLNNEGDPPEEWLVEYVADRAETTATVFMGLTWGCARCHDHKFDPITQRDYYELFAYFHNVPEIGNGSGSSNAPPMLSVPRLDKIEEFEAVAAELQPLLAKREALQKTSGFGERLTNWLESLTDEQQQKLPKDLREGKPTEWKGKQRQAAVQHFFNSVDAEGRALQAEIDPVQRRHDQLLAAGAKIMVMGELPEPRASHILNRGQYDHPGEPVSMRTPDWLPAQDDSLPRNRLGLAQWLVSPQHPLTSRVAVNRFWQQLFGNGLVRTPEDFGSQGELPTHPDLLDWLALDFVQHGWDVKRLTKQIVLSSTYRQSTATSPELLERDPANRWLARGPRYRLPAQVIRDQSLAASGLLVEELGGPPVKPYQPDGLWQEIIKGRPVYKPDQGKNLYRRSLYTLWRRAVKPPEMVLFDANERDTCTVNLRRTNTPLQALLLLNDVTFIEAARHLAARAMNEAGDDWEAQAQFCAESLLARPATPAELKILRQEYDRALGRFAADRPAADALLQQGASPVPEGLPRDELAAWTIVCRILLNLDETISKQ
ncbi:MAG: PSD1 and planctomycete cytochrome C domain-containing protein [Planctomycetaceae bacterium]